MGNNKISKNWEQEYKRDYSVDKFQEISHYWWRDCYDQIEQFVLRHVLLNKNSEILECGCGSGNSSLRLARKVKKIILFDISTDALKCARQIANYYKINNVEFIHGDVFHTPFSNKQFDFCWSIGLIEHFDIIQAKEILKEMLRVTKHSGYICVGVPNFASGAILKAKLLSFKPLKPLTFWIRGYRLSNEKKYDLKILKSLLFKVSEDSGIRLEQVALGYVGSVLPIETPEYVFRKINKFCTRLFSKFSFLILMSAKINHR